VRLPPRGPCRPRLRLDPPYRSPYDAQRVQLGEEADQVWQAAAKPIDRPGHHHVELPLGSIPAQPIKCWALFSALGADKESERNTGRPQGAVRDDQPDAREGQAGRPGESERFIVPMITSFGHDRRHSGRRGRTQS
jgi:hypothetical protein